MTAQKTLTCLSLVAAAGLLSGQAALADGGPRYTYAEGGWQYSEKSGTGIPGDDSPDGDGFFGGASYAVTDLFHVFASYGGSTIDVRSSDPDILNTDVDFTQLDVGAGINYGVTDAIDVVARAAYVDTDADVDGGGSSSDGGYRLEAGVRGMATPSLEINGGLSYQGLGSLRFKAAGETGDAKPDPSQNLAVQFGALYSITDWLAVGIGGSISGETKLYGATLRAYFGSR
jgi:hypothetical protein